MENRFGLKDVIYLGLLSLVLISIWFMILQYDRQWPRIKEVQRGARQNVEAQVKLERALDRLQASVDRLARTGIRIDGTTGDPGTMSDTPPSDAPAAAALPVFERIVAAKQQPGFEMGGELTDGFSGGVAKLTPLLSGDVSASNVQTFVLEALADRDPNTLEWHPLLAQSWDVQDHTPAWQAYVDEQLAAGVDEELLSQAWNIAGDDAAWGEFVKATVEAAEGGDQAALSGSLDRVRQVVLAAPDALTIRFTMRDGPQFADGTPVTAQDVVFTYRFTMDPTVNAPRSRAYYRRIADVSKTGPREVTFRYKEPYFEAFELAASFTVLSEGFYGSIDRGEFNQSVGYLFGSGPYRLPDARSWKPGDLIQLVRNERYWGVKPPWDRLVFREITNDVARLTAFRNGEVDIFNAFPEQYREMLSDSKLLKRTQHYDYASILGGYRFIAWNQRRNGEPTAFADKRVRQAMTLLTDRSRLIQEVMLGYANLATGPFNPLGKQADGDIEPWAYDVRRARGLLAEAGYTDRDGDGRIEGPDGQPFTFRLTYPSGSSNYEKMVLFLKDSYARAGVELVPDPLEWSVFTTRLEQKNFEAISLGWSAGIETDIFQMFHSSQTLAGGDNFMSYVNPELDRAIERARTTIDEAPRLALWREAHRILHEDQPYTFLFFGNSLVFLDNDIRNVEKIRTGLNPRVEWWHGE